MDFLNEAFRSLKQLNEETFDLTVSDDHEEIKDFLDTDDAIDTITIIDDEAEDEEEIKDSYIGKVILDCNICHSLIYKDPADVVIDDEQENANIDEECPYCYSTGDGFKIIGQVKPFTKEEEEEEEIPEEEEAEIEVKEDEVEDDTPEIEEESLTESCEEKEKLDELFDVDLKLDASGQSVGIAGGTGSEGGFQSVHEGCDEESQDESLGVGAGLALGGAAIGAGLVGSKLLDSCDSEDDEKDELKEGFNKVDIETDDSKMTMESDDSGKVTVTTEPIEKEEEISEISDEAIGPVDMETELDIEDNSKEEEPVEDMIPEEEPEDEIEVDEFDETSFDELGESYLKKVYENVEGFKCSSVLEDDNKLYIEGLIKFNSGKEKKTNFVFENRGITKDKKVMFEGFNEQIARSKKSFKLNGSVVDNKVVCESLSYRYNQNKNRVNGTVKR